MSVMGLQKFANVSINEVDGLFSFSQSFLVL